MNSESVVLMLAIALLVGVLFGKLAKLAKLPSVTGFLFAGVLLGPYLLGGIKVGDFHLGLCTDMLDNLEIIYTIAFCFICFSLGVEAKPQKLKAVGGKAAIIALVQAFAAFLLVGGVLTVVAVFTDAIDIPTALVLGALSAASAPSAKYMITRQYHTEGEISDIMLPIVALDDIYDIILFAIVLAVIPAFGISGEAHSVSFLSLIVAPVLEIVISIAIGIVLGLALGFINNLYKVPGARLVVCIGFILLAVFICLLINNSGIYLEPDGHGHGDGHISVSSLLCSIFMGGAYSFVSKSEDTRKNLDNWNYPLFILFFVLAGAGLDLRAFTDWVVLLVGAAYVILRMTGKYFGTYLGCGLMKTDPKVRKYLGVTLFPQADVVIGMAALSAGVLSESGAALVQSVIFLGAFIFEILGQLLIKVALWRAGEITADDDAPVEDEPVHDKEHTVKEGE